MVLLNDARCHPTEGPAVSCHIYFRRTIIRETPVPTAAMSSEIPQPPGVPLLGNVFDVNPNETWNSLIKLSEQYGKR